MADPSAKQVEKAESPSLIQEHRRSQVTPDQDAYRKLCAILLSMTLTLFIINIIQVCTLSQFHQPSNNPAYFIGLPVIVFGIFLLGAAWHIYENPHAFLPYGKRQPGTHQRGEKIDLPWTVRLARFGVIATAIANIVVVEFLYLNLSAIPDYEQIVWATASPSFLRVPMPSVALVEHSGLDFSAHLETNASTMAELCRAHSPPVQNNFNAHCFDNTGQWRGPMGMNYYTYFNGSDFGDMNATTQVNLYYAYTYSGNTTSDPTLEIVVFDQDFSKSQFETAYRDCSILPRMSLLARDRNALSLTQYTMDDSFNKAKREDACADVHSYRSYNLALSQLGRDTADVNCDVDTSGYKGGVCEAHVTINFATLLTTAYTSKHGTNRKRIFAEEGGFVGYVTVFTWFFDIFAK